LGGNGFAKLAVTPAQMGFAMELNRLTHLFFPRTAPATEQLGASDAPAAKPGAASAVKPSAPVVLEENGKQGPSAIFVPSDDAQAAATRRLTYGKTGLMTPDPIRPSDHKSENFVAAAVIAMRNYEKNQDINPVRFSE
jgi:hypothetical protein